MNDAPETQWFLSFFSQANNTNDWMLQVFLVVFATLVVNYILLRVLKVVEKQVDKSETLWDDALLKAAQTPVRLVVWIIGISVAVALIRRENDAEIFQYIGVMRRIAFIVVIGMFLNRFISFVEKNLIDPGRLSQPMDQSTASAMAKLLRLSVIITAALIILQTLGYSVSGVLAFGGIGGMAVGFAAKDLLANFFGGFMIYMDKPFSVGDWVRSPDRSIEGTVENIGWRLTRIRTFDKRPLYIPNATFTTIAVENPSRMSNRRIKETIGIRYDDGKKLSGIIAAVKTMLQEHDEIDTNQTLIVNFNSYSASSLDFFIYTFTKTTNWVKFHDVKQDVLLKIMHIVEEQGAEMAFPTSTVHLASMPSDFENFEGAQAALEEK